MILSSRQGLRYIAFFSGRELGKKWKENNIHTKYAKVIFFYTENLDFFHEVYKKFVCSFLCGKTLFYAESIDECSIKQESFSDDLMGLVETILSENISDIRGFGDEICRMSKLEKVDENISYFDISLNKPPIDRKIAENREVIDVHQKEMALIPVILRSDTNSFLFKVGLSCGVRVAKYIIKTIYELITGQSPPKSEKPVLCLNELFKRNLTLSLPEENNDDPTPDGSVVIKSVKIAEIELLDQRKRTSGAIGTIKNDGEPIDLEFLCDYFNCSEDSAKNDFFIQSLIIETDYTTYFLNSDPLEELLKNKLKTPNIHDLNITNSRDYACYKMLEKNGIICSCRAFNQSIQQFLSFVLSQYVDNHSFCELRNINTHINHEQVKLFSRYGLIEIMDRDKNVKCKICGSALIKRNDGVAFCAECDRGAQDIKEEARYHSDMRCAANMLNTLLKESRIRNRYNDNIIDDTESDNTISVGGVKNSRAALSSGHIPIVLVLEGETGYVDNKIHIRVKDIASLIQYKNGKLSLDINFINNLIPLGKNSKFIPKEEAEEAHEEVIRETREAGTKLKKEDYMKGLEQKTGKDFLRIAKTTQEELWKTVPDDLLKHAEKRHASKKHEERV